ncbi:MAG: hypothetical protein CL678_01235 [Bdellovibrionaceae bacterium]|nr:hypothetical protein [Pseudobdellovibrionaceae bacterium]
MDEEISLNDGAADASVTMSGKIVKDLHNGWETLPIMGQASGETATIVTESINVKQRYKLLSPENLDKQGCPTIDEPASEIICVTASGKRFRGMLVEQSSSPEDSMPAIAMLSKKMEIARGRALVGKADATEAMLCKWASNPSTAPDAIKELIQKNNNYVVSDFLVMKRTKTNAARKEKTGQRKSKQAKLSNASTTSTKTAKAPSSKRETPLLVDSKEPAEPVPAKSAKASQPKSEAKPVLGSKPARVKHEDPADPPSKRRRLEITVTISDASPEDLMLLSKLNGAVTE